MGKKNKLKRLMGRLNKETDCEIKAMPYSFDGVSRDIYLKVDLNHPNSLAVANIPYFLDEGSLKEFCSRALDTPIVNVKITATTALHGNTKQGYRSGHFIFANVQARRRAFDAVKVEPFKLEELNIKLPAWHNPINKRLGKRRHSTSEQTENMEITDTLESNNDSIDMMNKPDEDGWITVTRQHKFSFRGKINRRTDGTNIASENTKNISDTPDYQPKKKRRR